MFLMPIRPPLSLTLAMVSLLIIHSGSAEKEVNTALKPGGKWVKREVTLVKDCLRAPTEDSNLDEFGGHPSKRTQTTGFFHTQKLDNRWWIVNPVGGLFISRGVNSVSRIASEGGKSALNEKFKSQERWTTETHEMLAKHGFNTLGAWSTIDQSNQTQARTPLLSFMSRYGKIRGGTYQKPGHTGYPKDCPFIFDPAFESFCNDYAERVAPDRNDPSVLGYFSDNELPWSHEMLENYLSLPNTDPGHQAAKTWLEARKTKASSPTIITDADRADFLAFALDRYLSITRSALRRHAPNHLFLGPRLHGPAIRHPEVFRTLGKHVDIVCVNYYHAWSPSANRLEMWNHESGKPVMITEFYAKAGDVGLTNNGGAGWLVETQNDRGLFYQNFTIGLIASRVCVGWHWHRYADNDPDDTKVDPSNRDSNKGIVSNRYQPFDDLLRSMNILNRNTYALAAHFDSKKP